MRITGLSSARSRAILLASIIAVTIVAISWLNGASSAQSGAPRGPRENLDNSGTRAELREAENLGAAEAEDQLDLTVSFQVQNRAALDRFILDLHDPNSSSYHHWLTPEQFGENFGIAASDYQRMTEWLVGQGFQITREWPSRLQINFRGTVRQIASAFHTNINRYRHKGELYFANDRRPAIPAEFASIITHLHGLENFSQVRPASQQPEPEFSGGGVVAMAPKDLHQVYDLADSIAAGQDGRGVQIAIVARSNFKRADIRTFRSRFGLPKNDPKKILPFGPVRNRGGGEEYEVLLDAQWSGAAAPGAQVLVVIAPDVDQSLEYIVNKMPEVKIISMSFGLCEQKLGDDGISYFHDLYTQAVAQGQTVFVSTGDSGANDCGDRKGQQVNGLATSPNVVAVGGTSLNAQFNENGDAVSLGSESAWSDGGGGNSIKFEKPAYQQGVAGTAEDNHRSIPDVAQIADPYGPGAWIAKGGRIGCCIGGTSLAAPIWAGFMAIVNQQSGPQGNFNFVLYQMGSGQLDNSLPQVYHDTVTGDNGTNGVFGFDAVSGYDRATGWGTFNGKLFLNNLPEKQ